MSQVIYVILIIFFLIIVKDIYREIETAQEFILFTGLILLIILFIFYVYHTINDYQ